MIDLEKLENEVDEQIDNEKQETGFNTLGTLAQRELINLIKKNVGDKHESRI